MFTNQQHSQTLSFSVESKLFPKFILETSLSGSPENFRITLPAKPGLNDNINLNLSKSCPVKLDHLNGSSIGWHHTFVKGAPTMQYHIYLKFLQELNTLR